MTDSAKRSEIHLGDLAWALKTLHWTDDTQAQAIARCLGFGLQATPQPRAPTEIYDRQRYRRVEPEAAPPPQPRRVFLSPAPEHPPALPKHSLTTSLEPIQQRAPAMPGDESWLAEEDALFSEHSETALSRQPLLPVRTNRHILSAALATLRTGGEIDVPRLISAMCRHDVVAELPRKTEPTVELGCQLLLDYSATMVPFWEDLSALIDQVGDVIGLAATRVFSFNTNPLEAVHWTAEGKRESWAPEGRPLLAATDFGIQGRSGRAVPNPGWRELTERCAREGTPLVILIPWPEPRWPLDMGGHPDLVHWSPHTSAGMIKRKVGPGHRLR